MAKVSDLKEQARALERQGQLEKALTIYRHIIKHLEGTPAILRELPLYVKAGDLLLKLEEPETAIAMYERAAEKYAEHGSARSVIALCAKVLRVATERTDVHLRYASLMVDRGHVANAREVLVDYAERAQLDKTLAALAGLADRSDDEAKLMLEMLLESAELGERAGTESTAERVSTQLAALHEPEEPMVTHDLSEPAEAAILESPPGEPTEAPQAEVAAPAEPSIAEGTGTEQPPPGEPQRVPHEPPAPLEAGAAPTARASKPVRVTAPRRKSVAVRRKRRKSRSIGRWVAAVVVIGGGGAGLIWSGVIPLGGRFGSREPPGDVASPLATAARGDSIPVVAASDTSVPVAAPEDSVAQPISGGARDTAADMTRAVATPPPPAPIAAPVEPPDTARAVATPPPAPIAAPVEPPDTAAPSPGAGRPVIVVEGLEVESVTEIPWRGTTGYRVVQLLDSGERLTLTALPAEPGDTLGPGQIRVATMAGDTAVGTVRFGSYTVRASGLVSEDTLQALLRRLVERSPSN